jgi:hypothetical protein
MVQQWWWRKYDSAMPGMHLTDIFKKIAALFKRHPHPEPSLKSNPEFDKLYNDEGLFLYVADGFIFSLKDGPEKIKWTDIERLAAYKLDLITVDEIRMDITWNNRQFTISEETPGWFQFVLKTKAVFPAIPQEWDISIIHPAFERNYTVLYEKAKEL